MKEESEKAGLKLNIQKTKIMASGPITLWQIDGETTETVTDFIFLGSKVIVGGDCRPGMLQSTSLQRAGHDLFSLLSHVRLFVTPWTVACQAPLSMGFPRQEYWNGLPFPSGF